MRIFINDIIRTVARSLPQGFTLAIMLTVLAHLLKHGRIDGYINSLNEKKSRYFIYLLTYCYMVIYRTLLCRKAIYKPLSRIWQDWGIINQGEIKIEPSPFFGNTLMFTLLMILLMMNFTDRFKSKNHIIIKCTGISFLLSFLIETTQLITCRGTFQISDLVYNTLGGFIGSVIYIKFIDKKINT